MNRCLGTCASLLLIVCTARGVCAADPQGDYWPLKEGAKWHLTMKVRDQTIPMTAQIGKIETIDGQELARLEMVVNGNITATEHLSNTDKGIFRHKNNGVDITPPIPLLRYPVKKGDAWNLEVSSANQKINVNSSVDLEDITVPAGAYQAAVVTTESAVPGGKIINKQWFAPGVGLLKQTFQMPDGTEIVAELDKYEPGK